MVRIIVPATSANLGPGFDTLGIALSLYNEYTFENNDQFEFLGVEKKYASLENNLVGISYVKAFEYANEEIIPAKILANTNVPCSRGLGSSACCIIGGILGANYFLKNKLSIDEILILATKIEGHPDNVTPCLLGGLVASFVGEKVNYVKYDVSEEIHIKALIPEFPLQTEVSRKVLPTKYTREECVFNISRAINIPYAFKTGDIKLLYECLQDKIHQQYRFPLISESSKYLEYAKAKKLPLTLSGAGPTLLLLSKKEEMIDLETYYSWEHLDLKVCSLGAMVISDDK